MMAGLRGTPGVPASHMFGARAANTPGVSERSLYDKDRTPQERFHPGGGGGNVPTPDIALAACRRSVIRRGQRGRYAELGSVRLLKDEFEACGAKRK